MIQVEGTQAYVNTELVRCLADQTRRYDETDLKTQEATVIRFAGVDGCAAGWIVISVSCRSTNDVAGWSIRCGRNRLVLPCLHEAFCYFCRISVTKRCDRNNRAKTTLRASRMQVFACGSICVTLSQTLGGAVGGVTLSMDIYPW